MIFVVALSSSVDAVAAGKGSSKSSKKTKVTSISKHKPSKNKTNSKAKGLTKTKSKAKPKPKKPIKLNSEAAILMDLNSGKILYSKNIHEKLYPASTTKILTAIIALESGSSNRIVTVGKNPTLAEPSKIGLKRGERISLRHLLYALMVDSANDAAIAIAEYIGGSQANFAKMMNKKAKLIGCKDSYFVNPNGLPNTKHKTSAYDLAIITKYAMKNSSFRKIVSTTAYTIPATNMAKSRNLINHNKMILKSTKYYYSGCIGVKTGYTVAVKQTLVSAAIKGKRQLIAVVLKGMESPYYDVTELFNYGFGK
jgi:D-alanyl-D-alanine carboxypeptidase (penicillin-binding protein 5/6)